MTAKNELQVLLVQLRRDPYMCAHEKDEIIRSANIRNDQLTCVNVLDQSLHDGDYKRSDLVIIGGSGDFSIFDDLDFKNQLANWILSARETDKPLIGSCWGAQFMAHVLHGYVVTDIRLSEVGTIKVDLAEEAANDPLFYDFPSSFTAQSGHHQSIIEVPKGARILAKTHKAIQAFAWPGSCQYGFQFHPELTKKGLLNRIDHYRNTYAESRDEYDRINATAEDSPHTDDILERFIDRVIFQRT